MFDFSLCLSHTAFVTSKNEVYKYGDISSLSSELGQYLHPHSLVFILCSNTIGSIIGYVSSLQMSTVPLLLSKEIDKTLLKNLLNKYSPRYMWIPNEMICDFGNHEVLFSSHEYSLLKLEENIISLPTNLALLLTTSGSTGSPKLVRLSKENIIDNAKSIAQYLNINQKERAITSLPMHYSYGLSVINSHLVSAATVLLTEYSYIQREFWDFAVEQKATSFSGVPFTYEILKKMRFWNRNLPSLKTLTQAGGKLNNELIEYFAQNARLRGIDFYVMYGQTEATARMSYLPCQYTIEKLGSIGKAIPGGEFEIRNDSIISDVDTIGELVYKGKNVSLGYAECLDDLMRGDDNKGVLYTGDLAYRDKDGFYYIAGRKKRFLKLYGNRISLDYTESLLNQQFGNTFVCVGTDNKMIIYTIDSKIEEEIIPFLVNILKLNKTAFETRYIKSIPHSESGKILYSELPNE
ncbi:AMP-binding protein [Bacteroides cellulosilyticus]|uniref:AMP-binding protein n=1 Tax=Bacteroides cellulosilyticus TaxID=246787 RepID=UPI001C37B1F9|nr:AMP-binding protein [Bacteroides cellulosilyticus]MBV3639839.1 AMP-binding protein [Bacteroides cellulosilyticus]MBV3665837.1 AMP-binding protein [Bacteroides cellulosilyticus]MBV3687956.1 AMP-binding protein [Bacteroides cellulosilyticus]MBV3696662.1 AMP-binding protein [Bacteroides cellulosilyticus]MBV3710227.1 AMP-binding protein [Bacteroides cellulosilyticus]